MSKARRPQPPAALKASGKRLWRKILADLAQGWELDARELHLLERACRCGDHIDALEKVIRRDGAAIEGSRGQTIAHPALSEARQLMLVQARLLGSLELDDPKRQPSAGTTASQRGSYAAAVRWGNG